MLTDRQPVAVYARISEDPTGEAQGVARQLDLAREHAERRGLRIVAEYTDNNISATHAAHRPGYAAFMDALPAREFSAVLVFHTSRLWRNREQRAKGIRVLAEHGVSVLAVKGPELDLSTAYGRGMAGLLGEFDTMESEIKSERIRVAAAQRAKEGRRAGCSMFGWMPAPDPERPGRTIDVIDEPAAAVVREATRRLLTGESLASVTRWVQASGVLPPKAHARQRQGLEPAPEGHARVSLKWTPKTVRMLVTRPANVALRLHHRGSEDEQLYPAAWPPIVDVESWESVRALLAPNARPGHRSDREHLLTGRGIASCGVCGGVLRSAMKGGARGKKARLYVCQENGCVGRNLEAVDAHVRAVVLARLEQPDALDLLTPPAKPEADPAKDDARRLRAMLDQAAESFAAGRIGIEQLETITARVNADLARAEAATESRAGLPPGMLSELTTAVNLGKVWDGWDVLRRRALVLALGMRVRIDRTRQGPGYKPEGTVITWTTEDDQ